jgi:hypothetical protein
VADGLRQQPADNGVAGEDLHGAVIGAACDLDATGVEHLGNHQRQAGLGIQLRVAGHAEQRLDGARVRLVGTALSKVGRRHDHGRRVGEVHTLQVLQPQGGTGAEDDLALVPEAAEAVAQFDAQAGRYLVGEDGNAQRAHAAQLQEPAHPGAGHYQFLDDGGRAVGPADDEDVVALRHGREPRFQASHAFVQPLRHDGHEGAQEYHVAQHGEQRGHDAQQGALVVPQVTGVGEAQERPPHSGAQASIDAGAEDVYHRAGHQ